MNLESPTILLSNGLGSEVLFNGDGVVSTSFHAVQKSVMIIAYIEDLAYVLSFATTMHEMP